MFVQSAKFKDAHQEALGKQGDLAIYGQELMAQTRRLCLMNHPVHQLDGELGQTYDSSSLTTSTRRCAPTTSWPRTRQVR